MNLLKQHWILCAEWGTYIYVHTRLKMGTNGNKWLSTPKSRCKSKTDIVLFDSVSNTAYSNLEKCLSWKQRKIEKIDDFKVAEKGATINSQIQRIKFSKSNRAKKK